MATQVGTVVLKVDLAGVHCARKKGNLFCNSYQQASVTHTLCVEDELV